jgi:hypothetical protein
VARLRPHVNTKKSPGNRIGYPGESSGCVPFDSTHLPRYSDRHGEARHPSPRFALPTDQTVTVRCRHWATSQAAISTTSAAASTR